MKILSTKDSPSLRVVRIVLNPDEPETIHLDGSLHTKVYPTELMDILSQRNIDILTLAKRELYDARLLDLQSRIVEPQEWCLKCIYNWQVQEFTFNGEELEASLNKWGNPIHDGEEVVSTRAKVWDELYQEIDEQMGEHIVLGNAPRERVPTLAPEVELEFELVSVGDPYMENGLAMQRYKVLRLGMPKWDFIAAGADQATFTSSKDSKYAEAQEGILESETSKAVALAIVGG